MKADSVNVPIELGKTCSGPRRARHMVPGAWAQPRRRRKPRCGHAWHRPAAPL